MTTGGITACPTGYNANTSNGKSAASQCQISCAGGSYIATANASSCTNAGTSYWAAGGLVNYGSTSVDTRTACPTGLTTTGSGRGADDACDCGRVLHLGDNTVRLSSCQKTEPAMKFDYNKDGRADLFANMVQDTGTVIRMSQGSEKSFKTIFQNKKYYVCDDTTMPQ
jgi:hypothetical protein